MKSTSREIRERLRLKERTARRVLAVGRARGDKRDVAYRCAWCDAWYSPDDEQAAAAGARVSDGICETCEAKHFGEL
jgi:hypothetical protein